MSEDNLVGNERFVDRAVVVQLMKSVCRSGYEWDDMDNPLREALDMILSAIGTVTNDDAYSVDAWMTISSYSMCAGAYIRGKDAATQGEEDD